MASIRYQMQNWYSWCMKLIRCAKMTTRISRFSHKQKICAQGRDRQTWLDNNDLRKAVAAGNEAKRRSLDNEFGDRLDATPIRGAWRLQTKTPLSLPEFDDFCARRLRHNAGKLVDGGLLRVRQQMRISLGSRAFAVT